MTSADKYATLGYDYHWRPEWHASPDGQWARRVLSYLPLTGRGLHVLDAGCGDGWPASLLTARGYQVHGVDIEDGALAVARQKVPGATFGTTWPTGGFDFVLALESLEHMADPAPLVEAVNRCAWYALVSTPLPGHDAYAVHDYDLTDVMLLFMPAKVKLLDEDGVRRLYRVWRG